MGFRRFTDRQGNRWEVKPRSRHEWHFEPVQGNPEGRRVGNAPGYEQDPFELSEQELTRILDAAKSAGLKSDRPSIFKE